MIQNILALSLGTPVLSKINIFPEKTNSEGGNRYLNFLLVREKMHMDCSNKASAWVLIHIIYPPANEYYVLRRKIVWIP